MQTLQTRGIILRKTNFGENDVIFDILSENGKVIGFFAKGARRIKSKFAGVLQLGYVVIITYSVGKNLNYPSEIIIDKENLFSFYSKTTEKMNFYTDVISIIKNIAKDLESEELFNAVIKAFIKAELGEIIVDVYNDFLIEVLQIIEVDTRLRCHFSGEFINEKEFYYSPDSNKVFNIENKPKSIDLPRVSYDNVFYKTFLQRLIYEHVSSRIRLKF